MPRLSVCLIVRNEASHLSRCLQSVRGLADEIVVVDTGSTDDTVAIARHHGARVSTFAWQDDFSVARNASIEQAKGEWILALDADESIAEGDHAVIRREIARDDIDAQLVPQRHYLPADTVLIGWQPGPGGYAEGGPYPGFVDVDCRRLFRRVPWLRFRKPVHEELVSLDAARPLRETRGAWVIHHYGKLGGREVLRAKGDAYLRIGHKKAESCPRDPQAHFEVGVQYAELGEHASAIACFEQALQLSPRFRDAQLRIGLCHFERKDYRAALSALRESARTLPEHAADIALAEGNTHRELGDFDASVSAFRRALAASPGLPSAAINLALVYASQRRFVDGVACLGESLDMFPHHTELRVLRGSLHVDAGDEDSALCDLERAPSDPRALRIRARILAQHRRFADARACLTALPVDAEDPQMAALLGAVALGLGEVAVAVDHLRRSVAGHPTPDATLNLSTALEAHNDRPGALDAAVEASRLAPADHAVLARVSRLLGEDSRRRARQSPRLTIVFYQPCSIPFDGTTPRTRGLGGTESAIVYLAESLAARGHRVVVLNNCERPTTVECVEYARWEDLALRCAQDRPDVVVAVRFWEGLGAARLAPVQIFWTGDAFDQPFVKTLSNAAARREIDFVMLQSDWHEETFQAHHHLSSSRILRTTLGAAASANAGVSNAAPRARGRRLAYASTPFRGLDVLLDLFPRIRAKCPDAALDVYSSMQVYGVPASDDRRQFEPIYRKASQPGVTLVGSLPQAELANRLQQARVLAYPNHYAETFCIAVAEAQAAGCAVVTSALGALPETVGEGGICLPGDPRSARYQQAFVDACVRLLRDDTAWEAMSARASTQAAERYSWPLIAERWESLCRAALVDEPAEIERVAVHLTAGRAGLAQRMLARVPQPIGIPDSAWRALTAFVAHEAGDDVHVAHVDLRLIALYFGSIRRSGTLDRIELPLSAAS
jgi:glycosyltransferase involved in cell wall biosynthesis/Flp pilus assembly protein TadD